MIKRTDAENYLREYLGSKIEGVTGTLDGIYCLDTVSLIKLFVVIKDGFEAKYKNSFISNIPNNVKTELEKYLTAVY